MILNCTDAKYCYNGIIYTIGDKVFANDESDYAGLYGTILEICDGDDKETGNDTPDIVCSFLYPVHPDEVARMEAHFSDLYRTPKRLTDLALDMVIMTPEMLQVLTPATACPLPLYQVREEWNYDGDGDVDITIVSDIQLARHKFLSLLNEELQEGRCVEWPDNRLGVEAGPDSYCCWLADEYCSNHYKVTIEPLSISISSEMMETVGKHYVASQFRKQFAEQIECWEEVAELTPEQMAELLSSPDIPDRIRKQLEENGYLEESYWESVSEAAFFLVNSFIKRLTDQKGGGEQ